MKSTSIFIKTTPEFLRNHGLPFYFKQGTFSAVVATSLFSLKGMNRPVDFEQTCLFCHVKARGDVNLERRHTNNEKIKIKRITQVNQRKIKRRIIYQIIKERAKRGENEVGQKGRGARRNRRRRTAPGRAVGQGRRVGRRDEPQQRADCLLRRAGRGRAVGHGRRVEGVGQHSEEAGQRVERSGRRAGGRAERRAMLRRQWRGARRNCHRRTAPGRAVGAVWRGERGGAPVSGERGAGWAAHGPSSGPAHGSWERGAAIVCGLFRAACGGGGGPDTLLAASGAGCSLLVGVSVRVLVPLPPLSANALSNSELISAIESC